MYHTAVLDYWFGADRARPLAARDFWFRKSAIVDSEIRARFGATVEEALAGRLEEWRAEPGGTLALILLLDQFTRNIFRDTSRAFAGDVAALGHARSLVESGAHRQFEPVERWFIYLPFEHSERLSDQRQSLQLFGELAADGLDGALEWAQKHYDVIRRFGRFPHRNELLGRASTADELAFLQQPGSRF